MEFTLACWWGTGGLHTTLVGRDVTHRKLAEEALARQARALVHQARELERSNEDLEQFATAVSHDLREPLRKIAGYADLLSDRYRERLDEKATRCLDLMVDGARRLQGMIDDLLGYCRAGQRDFRPGPTDLGGVFDRVCANLEVAIREADARITHDPLPTLCADPALLERVLQNLLANAVKFRAAEAPQVHVSAVREGGGWDVSVRDNGIGIDPLDSAGLFVPFRRLHTRAEFPGTGIGLALCKRIVERHGGRIWVESRVGAGSTFRFHLPDGAASSPAAEPSEPAALVKS